MELLIGFFIVAVIFGIIADKRGHNGVLWFFICLFTSPLIAGLFMYFSESNKDESDK